MKRKSVSGNRYVNDQVQRAVGEHKELDPSVLALTLTLYRTMGTFERASQAEFGLYDLTPSLFNILTVLHRADDAVTMRELGRAISVRPTNLTSLVDTLVARGLVERVINEADRRSYFIRITPNGEDFLTEFLPGHWTYLQGLLSGLSREDRLELIRLLDSMEHSVMTAMKDAPSEVAPSNANGSNGVNGASRRKPLTRQKVKGSA
jgi:DNA-binding MarR family transcriptional regulator